MAHKLLFEEDILEKNHNNANENFVIPSKDKINKTFEEFSAVSTVQHITAQSQEVLSGKNMEITQDIVKSSVLILGKKKSDNVSSDTDYDDKSDNSNADSRENNVDTSDESMTEGVDNNVSHTNNQQEGNTSQDNSLSGKTGARHTENIEDKVNKEKGKKRSLEVEVHGTNKNGKTEDDTQIYRKYKLRRTDQSISYKEPKDLRPEECEFQENKVKRSRPRSYSSDDSTNSLNCSVCQRDFRTKRALQIHIRSHNNTITQYKCSLCSEKFNKNSDLIAHKSVHASESFLCVECKLAFSNHSDFLQHNLTHATMSHFTCPECGLRFAKNSFKRHILIHFDKKVTCSIFSLVCNGECNLERHLNQHKYKVTCVECGKVLKSKTYYEYHLSTHTGVKRYQCLYCGRGFGRHSMREVHTRTHTGEKPFTCNICGHKAKQSSNLQRHMTKHATEKKFSCNICNKKYSHEDTYRSHLRAHNNTRLYECPDCDRTFLYPGGLKVHVMYKHLSERPVVCKYCNIKFINNNQLQRHSKKLYHQRNKFAYDRNLKTREDWNKRKGGKV